MQKRPEETVPLVSPVPGDAASAERTPGGADALVPAADPTKTETPGMTLKVPSLLKQQKHHF